MILEHGPLPDPADDSLWSRYLETCRRLNVTPVSRDRATELVDEWNAAMRAALEPPTKH